ncbi:putative receptor-like protein kinase At5g24010 [Silene latifolia]|uniref:putative receptor-like protein kinase At5g24010 n=1 Tax=Silene latifolia TaxID=37657 RepID=UPI003D777A2F
MAKLSNLLPFSLLIFTILHHVTSSFTPLDNYLINCGPPLFTILDSYNREFTSDESPLPDSVKLSSTRTIPLTELTTPSGRLYNSARIFVEPSGYSFKINQKGTHLIRLHFHRLNFEKFDGKIAKFHVLADGYLLLNEFSLLNLKNDVEIHEFVLLIDCDYLELLFVPVGKTSFGFVSAIEVVSAPKDLILDIAEGVNANGVSKINGMVKNGFETLFRVNVGGPKITPFNDTLWRTWVPDNEFLKSSVESKEVHFSGRIKYQVGGASREVAPDHVYGSARVMAGIDGLNASDSKDRLSWAFPVVGGYKYLVRVHFCDIVSRTLGSLYFNVYVNGILAYENLDLSALTNSLASPYYIDLVVDGGDSGVITVSVGSSALGVNAILNGVEVFKMSNAMKSFDGMVSAETVLRSCQGRTGFPLVFAIAIGVLLAVSLLLRKILVKVQDNVAWSRLPVDISEVALKSSYQ